MAFLVPSVEFSSISPAKFVAASPRNVGNLTVLKKKNSRGRVRVRVCSRIKDMEVGVSKMGRNLGLCVQFSAPVTSPLRPSKEDEEKQNYYVNLGYAIRTLREEFPKLFDSELSFDIYRDDVVLKDPFSTFFGIENYKLIFWALRFHGRIFFRALWVDIVSVWQPSESIIMVRWTVHGDPRVPWESRGRFDGTSEYKLDKNGKIYEHKVHNIALNRPPKFRVLAVDELIQSISGSSTPKPTYFEISPSSIMYSVRHYLILIFAFAQRPTAELSRRRQYDFCGLSRQYDFLPCLIRG